MKLTNHPTEQNSSPGWARCTLASVLVNISAVLLLLLFTGYQRPTVVVAPQLVYTPYIPVTPLSYRAVRKPHKARVLPVTTSTHNQQVYPVLQTRSEKKRIVVPDKQEYVASPPRLEKFDVQPLYPTLPTLNEAKAILPVQGEVKLVGFTSGLAVGNAAQGPVKTGGFGNGYVFHGSNHGTVKMADIGTNLLLGTHPVMKRSTRQIEVTVTSHPVPVYTYEAKQLHIVGEVVLRVRFQANGRVKVLKVVSGLGHGLDEEAIKVAKKTSFIPANSDGTSVDETTNYRVIFNTFS